MSQSLFPLTRGSQGVGQTRNTSSEDPRVIFQPGSSRSEPLYDATVLKIECYNASQAMNLSDLPWCQVQS
jgi:hypothetical protein